MRLKEALDAGTIKPGTNKRRLPSKATARDQGKVVTPFPAERRPERECLTESFAQLRDQWRYWDAPLSGQGTKAK